MDETREGYQEVAALLSAIAKTFDISDMDCARAIDDGRLGITPGIDDNGNKYVGVTLDDKSSRVYLGAILHGAK